MSIDIPLVDLKAQYALIQPEIDAAIQAVIDRAAFAGGPFVEAFEANFAAFCGTRYAIGTSSGTSALHLVLLVVEVGPGDEVITVPNTFVATVEAIVAVGARPVLVDVEERYHTLDPGALEAAITPQTKAIIPVHLYGQPADMEPIETIARNHGLTIFLVLGIFLIAGGVVIGRTLSYQTATPKGRCHRGFNWWSRGDGKIR